MPHYLAIGVTKYEILHSTLNGLKVYDKAYKMKREMHDEMLYLSGIYTYEAVTTALSNAFRKKGSKAIEYRKEPILQQTKPLTEKDIERKRKEFIAKMEVLMANFNVSHKNTEIKEDGGEQP